MTSKPIPWWPWLIGAALLAAVVAAAFGLAEEREFARLLEHAEPWWILIALILQAATYLAQAEVFRGAPQRAGFRVSRPWLSQLSLTKLFLDQALPSAGLSSTAVVIRALQAVGVSRQAAAACAVINIASYHAAYIVTLVAALVTTSMLRETNPVLVATSAMFILFAIALAGGMLWGAGRHGGAQSRLQRLRVTRAALAFLADADAALVRSPRVFGAATAWQVAIFLLDAATMWVCIRALGVSAPVDAVFVSVMVSSLVRTMGVVPGGLGTYEATSVLTLRAVGLTLSVALSATLIFRGLSFWIPMLPGLWSSRRIMKSSAAAVAEGPRPD